MPRVLDVLAFLPTRDGAFQRPAVPATLQALPQLEVAVCRRVIDVLAAAPAGAAPRRGRGAAIASKPSAASASAAVSFTAAAVSGHRCSSATESAVRANTSTCAKSAPASSSWSTIAV